MPHSPSATTKCTTCDDRAVFITPRGYLCPDHALQAMRADGGWLVPAVVSDPSDPKIVHLHGLNLSRAWMLEGMAAGLPNADGRVAALRAAAGAHRAAGLPAVTAEHYEGGHWLGSFATYLVTARGIQAPRAR